MFLSIWNSLITQEIDLSNNKKTVEGEVSGAFLLGMLNSFGNVGILPLEQIPFSVKDISPTDWYPYDYLISLNDFIEEQVPHSSSILFWAGVRFIELWYWQGEGKDMINGSIDWLYCNHKGGGYNSVVRGREVGWCRNRFVDEAQGVALVENVMPISPAFLRGVFFGGFYLFDDLTYFNTEIESVSHDSSYPFQCTVIKINFKQPNPCIQAYRLAELRDQKVQLDSLTDYEANEVLWRYRHELNLSELKRAYHDYITELTEIAFKRLQQLKEDLASANMQLTLDASTDVLTGLNNRRYFNRETKRIFNLAKREQHSLCAMMIDIDYFKRYNDHYGHLAGDEAIKAVAESIESNVTRAGDLVARFGGEEFVVLLVDTDQKGVEILAAKIAASLQARKISHEKSKTSPNLTVSIGSAMHKGSEQTIEELLQLADIALYRAKEQGRNCHVHLNEASTQA